MVKKKVPINYYSRDFDSIKESLVRHAKRYYPDSYKDFGEAGFGSLMLDTVSYVGDVLSFYLDYQANESFLDTANERKNIIRLSRQFGYKFDDVPSSQGIASFYIFVPANATGNDIDERYLPTLKKGSTFSSQNGTQFILAEDVIFKVLDNNVRIGRRSDDGTPTYYIVKTDGIVISGEMNRFTVDVGNFQKFLRIKLPENNISEIMSVFDSEGNEYYEVEYLTQDIVFRPVFNAEDSKKDAKALLRPYSVPRRFVVEKDGLNTYLQFGQGFDESKNIKESLIDPSQRVLKYHGKNYFSDKTFDPSNLVDTDKFGLVPYNTTLEISVRTNRNTNVNIGINTLNTVKSINLEFEDVQNLNSAILSFMRTSLEVSNEQPILGKVTQDTLDEIKIKSANRFASQNRAVTFQDYESLVYSMPNEYGNIKRVSVKKDLNSFKRNMNIYVVSEDENGYFSNTNMVTKENLKVWLNNYRMLNDTIDILDAKILNIGIDFQILTDLESNKYDTLVLAKNSVSNLMSRKPEIGQPIYISDIINSLKNTKGVLDVISVNVVNKTGGNYSSLSYDLEANLSKEGRYIKIPDNVVFELKFPNSDIKGVVI
jgi:hypothetical protein